MRKNMKRIFIFLIVMQNLFSQQRITSFYHNAEVLVTGGAGFIGSHLVETLVNLGSQVTVLDNLSSGNIDNLKSVTEKITFIQGSITNLETCLEATKNKKIIFHLAAFVSVPDSLNNPLLNHTINDLGTLYLLESARINKVERFIFSSSCAVYGNKSSICQEDDFCHPESPYGFSKYIGEQYCKEYYDIFRIKTVILRYFNVYGPRQNPCGSYAAVVAKFNQCMEQNTPVTIFGDGTQTRDFVPVEHIVEANIFLGAHANDQNIHGEIFNIATGTSISVIDLVKLLKKNHSTYSQEPIFREERKGDIKHTKANINKYFIVKQKTLDDNRKK